MIDAGIAIVGGILVGLLIRSPLFESYSRVYNDADIWEVAGDATELESPHLIHQQSKAGSNAGFFKATPL